MPESSFESISPPAEPQAPSGSPAMSADIPAAGAASAAPPATPPLQPAAGAPQGEPASPESAPEGTPTPSAEEQAVQRSSSYQQRVAEITNLRTQVETLSRENYLPIDRPADEWDVTAHLQRMSNEMPEYYNRLAWENVTTHLPEVLPMLLQDPSGLPPELVPVMESAALNVIQAYTGLTGDQLIEAITQYRGASGAPYSGQPSASAEQYGLDPVNNQGHAALLRHLESQQRELAGLRESVTGFENTTTARANSEASAKLHTVIDQSRSTLLSKIEVPKGHESALTRIESLVKAGFDSDPIAQTAMESALKFYRQGTPDLSSAAVEVSRMQGRLEHHVQEAVKTILEPIAELERLKLQMSQLQGGVRHIPSGGTAPVPQGQRPQVTSDTIGDLAVQSLRSKVPPLTPQ